MSKEKIKIPISFLPDDFIMNFLTGLEQKDLEELLINPIKKEVGACITVQYECWRDDEYNQILAHATPWQILTALEIVRKEDAELTDF